MTRQQGVLPIITAQRKRSCQRVMMGIEFALNFASACQPKPTDQNESGLGPARDMSRPALRARKRLVINLLPAFSCDPSRNQPLLLAIISHQRPGPGFFRHRLKHRLPPRRRTGQDAPERSSYHIAHGRHRRDRGQSSAVYYVLPPQR